MLADGAPSVHTAIYRPCLPPSIWRAASYVPGLPLSRSERYDLAPVPTFIPFGVLAIVVTDTEITVSNAQAPQTAVYRVERKRRLH